MRTFDEIDADIRAAISAVDVTMLRSLSQEMQALSTPIAEAAAANTTAYAEHRSGNYTSALEHYMRAYSLYVNLANQAGIARTTGHLGIVYTTIGDYPAALQHYQRALHVYEQLDDPSGIALVTGNMGIAYYRIGDFTSALEHHQRALELYDGLGDRAGVARITGNIGLVYDSTGEHRAALEHYQRALEVYNEVGNRAGAALVTGNIGLLYSSSGDYSSALEHYRRALEVYDELGNRGGVALITGNVIGALLASKQFTEAAKLLDLQESMQMYSPAIRAEHMANRATLAEHHDNLNAARAYLEQARDIVAESGDLEYGAAYHLRLRDLAQKNNDFARYIEHNTEHHRMIEEIRGREVIQRMTMMEASRTMEAERRQRERERALLYGALPQSVADRMIRGERVTSDHFPLASVIFLDIVDFTTISDRIPPGHVVHLLEQIFSTLDGVCKIHGVTKIKTIGDCYMAVHFTDVHAATLCAVEMRSAMNALHVTMPTELGDTSWTNTIDELHVRIGIHCGPVTAGVIGTERLQYDVWGDTVNVASRMESTGQAGCIHVSSEFAARISDNLPREIRLKPRGEIEVKGKGLMTTYWLE